MSRPWNVEKREADQFKCCCGGPAFVAKENDQYVGICIIHEAAVGAIWPLPPEAPDDFVSGFDQDPPESVVDWIESHSLDGEAEDETSA